MNLRLFQCPACGHHLRFGAQRCGRCHDLTPFYNHKAEIVLILALVLAGFVIMVLLF